MKKKWILRSIGIFFAVLFVGIAVSFLFVIRNIDRYADYQLREAIDKTPLPYHKIDFSSVELKLKGRIVIIKNITIRPDSLTLKDTSLKELSFKHLVEFSCDELRITRINLFKLLLNKSLDIDTLIMQRPVFHFVQSGLEGLRSVSHVERYLPGIKEPAHPGKKYRIRWIHIEELLLNNGQLIIGKQGEKRPLIKNKCFSLNLSGFQINMKKIPDRKTGFNLKDMQLEVEQEEISLPGGMYSLYTGHVSLSMSKAYTRIDTLHLIPLYDMKEFGKITGRQTDRFDIQVGSIEAFGINILNLCRNSSIRMRKLQVDNMNLQAFRDKNDPFDFSRFPALPQESIGKMKNYLQIDSLVVSNGFIEYLELMPGAPEPGRIFLDSLNAIAMKITNDSVAMKANEMMTVKGNFRLMGNGMANVNIFLPLGRNDGGFEFNGVMYGLSTKTLNPFIEPYARVRFNTGFISKVEFYAQARDNVATGKFMLLYKGLNLSILPKYGGENDTQEKQFLSFIANELIRSDNPKNGIEKVSNLYFERNRNKGILNFMIKTLLQGILDIAAPSDKNIEKRKEGGEDKTSGKKKE